MKTSMDAKNRWLDRSLTSSSTSTINQQHQKNQRSDAAWHASTDADAPRLADLSAAFASSIDPELAREAAPKLAAVLKRMAAFYSSQNAPRCSLLPLTMALRKMQRNSSGGTGEITPLHPLLFEAALQAQNPRAALPVLDDLLGGGGGNSRNSSSASAAAPTELSLAPETTGVSTRDVLLTLYLGGLLRASRREWDLAAAAFALALGGVPAAAAPSSIASEAFKKWTLVRVAAGRGSPSVPTLSEHPAARAASPAVLRAVKADAAAYLELARAAGKGVAAYAAAAAKEGGAPFCLPGSGGDSAAAASTSGDGQLGLLRAAVRGERDRALAALSRVFAALPLGDVLSKAGEDSGRRSSAAAPQLAVEEEAEEEEDENGGEEGEEEAAADALRSAAAVFGGDEGQEGGGEEEAMEQEGEQQEVAAFGRHPPASPAQPPRSSSRRRQSQQQQQQQQQPSPASRRASAEAHASELAAARAASASFEASLLPARLASSKEGGGDGDEEEAERALWSLADTTSRRSLPLLLRAAPPRPPSRRSSSRPWRTPLSSALTPSTGPSPSRTRPKQQQQVASRLRSRCASSAAPWTPSTS